MNWEDAYTEDGHRVEIDRDPYIGEAIVKLDGVTVEVKRVRRLRDGGTTFIETSAGEIVCPRRLGSTDRTPRVRLV